MVNMVSGYNSCPWRARMPLALLLFTLFLGTVSSAQVAPPAAEYVGSELCGLCHAEQLSQLQKTGMAVLFDEKYPPEQRGCEACHGPGSAHVEAISEATDEEATRRAAQLIYSFTRGSTQENTARCQACHRQDEKQRLYDRSRHLGAGVSCVECHSPHRLNPLTSPARPPEALAAQFSVPERPAEREWLNNSLVRDNQPGLCYSCHRDIEAQFQLPIRHRVNEGVVQCTDCHNPHGSITASELRATGTEACYSCHVEKRGPFVFEHAASRVEGCTACHTPHGSINRQLLKRRQDRQLCLECHTAPEALNVPHPRLGFQAAGECTRCHIDVHGSNYQRQFLR